MDIIVASSNVFHRELSSFILSEAGYTVHECSDGDGFLRCVTRVQPDMVLLDARISGANSLDLAREVRRQSHVPIMFLTNGVYSVPLPSLRACADDHVVWPYEPENLLAQVHALLYRSGEVTPAPSKVAH